MSVSTAQDNASFEGKWKIDIAKSDFGSDPPLKSLIVTVSKVPPDSLSVHTNAVDASGKRISHSWVGPMDGSMHPFKGEDVKQSIRKDGNTLIRHGEIPDGSTFDARDTLSEDGNTVTEEMTMKSKDGKEDKGKTVMHRVTKNEKKPGA